MEWLIRSTPLPFKQPAASNPACWLNHSSSPHVVRTGMPARFFDRTLFTRIVSRSRYELAFLAFFGFFNVYAMRVNLSVAVVTMKEQYGARHHVSRKIATPGHAFRITR